jgi:DNA-binding transcriptional LysR family regulator
MTVMSRMRLRVAFDAFLPVGRYGPLFHILSLELPDLRFDWHPLGFPAPGRPLLDGADVGVFVEPPTRAGLTALTIDLSPMVVLTSVGHRLAQQTNLSVADILDESFLGAEKADPEWRAFWTLDKQRGGPPKLVGDAVDDAEHGLHAVASGRAIATVPAWATDGMPHPGVVALLLDDGPWVATRLLWSSEHHNPIINAFVELADDLTRNHRERPRRGVEQTQCGPPRRTTQTQRALRDRRGAGRRGA